MAAPVEALVGLVFANAPGGVTIAPVVNVDRSDTFASAVTVPFVARTCQL